LIVVASIVSPDFLSLSNGENILEQSTPLLLVAVGQTFMLLVGAIDLSVGATIGLVVILVPNVLSPGSVGALFACLIGLCAGAVVGLANGLIVTRLRLQAFIVTLAMSNVILGVGLFLRASPPRIAPASFSPLLLGSVGVVPIPLILVGVVILSAAALLRQTRFGRHIYAVGSNQSATRLAGMRTDAVMLGAFVLCGALAALAGIYLGARTRSSDVLIGSPFVFASITAAVVGGVSLFGGRGSVFGTFAAVFALAVAGNLMDLVGVSAFLQYFVQGVFLVVAVVLYYERG
jgi:ribose transport system permease protein